MAKRGCQANWIEDLPPELRKRINDALDCEEPPTALHERLALSPYCSLRTLQSYARKRRPRTQIFDEAGEMVQALTQGRDDFTDLQKMALGRVVATLLLPGIKPTVVASLAREINEFERMTYRASKDARAEEKHAAWRREHNAKLLAQAQKKAATQDGKLSVADVAKLLEELDMAEPV